MKTFLTVHLLGALVAYVLIQLCVIIADKKDKAKIDQVGPFVCLFSSWALVAYVIYQIYRGFTESRRQDKINKTKGKEKERKSNARNDSELVKITIDNYWAKVVEFPDFDLVPSLPIQGSPLCAKYYFGKTTNHGVVHCTGCPIKKAQFGCTQTGFYLRYISANTVEERRDAAIKVGKLFASIHKELVMNGK